MEIKQAFVLFPIRFRRFVYHFSYLIPRIGYLLPAKPTNGMIWLMDLIFYTTDLLGFNDLLHICHIVTKRSFRKLTNKEKEALYQIFHDSINYDAIWIDDQARIGLKKLALAYVLFNSINYDQHIEEATLMHETVHIWQYQNVGSMYLGRALLAQRLKDPYDFGGAHQLYHDMILVKPFLSYNFEQQGAIIEYLVTIQQKKANNPLLDSIFLFYKSELLQFRTSINLSQN